MAQPPPPLRISLVDLLSSRYAPIQESILSILRVDDITRLCNASKSFSTDLRNTAWNYNKLLHPFFSDPEAFRSLQGRWNAILTGGLFLDFFTRTESFSSSNDLGRTLELVVPHDHNEAVWAFLQNEGYRNDMFDKSEHGSFWAGSQWWKLGHGGQRVTIEHHVATDTPIRDILEFGSQDKLTSLMNFATWNKAYSLFPIPTVIKHEGFLLGKMSETMATKISRLADAGYKTKDVDWFGQDYDIPVNSSELSAWNGKSMTRRRRVGDALTWTMRLPVHGVVIPEIPDGVIEVASFQLHGTNVDFRESNISPMSYYHIHAGDEELCHSVLKYTYSINVAGRHGMIGKVCFIRNRLNSLAIMELYKVQEDQRPASFWHILNDPDLADPILANLTDFIRPESWTYYDEDVIEYLVKVELVDGEDNLEEDCSYEE
jgi:hypothetical protein